MTVLQAILPVLGLLAGGACVGAFAYFGKRKHEKDGLPTDPLTELDVYKRQAFPRAVLIPHCKIVYRVPGTLEHT